MELNELKSGWQNAGAVTKTEASFQKMTQFRNNPSLKKIRRKFLAETMGLSVFLFVYYDWFDGDKKPFLVNVFLVTGLVLYILNDIIGFVSLNKLINGTSLSQSLRNYLNRVKRLFMLSVITSTLYSIALIFFFTSVIDFTQTKIILLAGLVIIMTVMIILSIKTWKERIRKLEQQMSDMEQD